jgi:hypothetical protein
VHTRFQQSNPDSPLIAEVKIYEYDLLRALMAILTVFPIPLTSF